MISNCKFRWSSEEFIIDRGLNLSTSPSFHFEEMDCGQPLALVSLGR